jgi:TonB family protein
MNSLLDVTMGANVANLANSFNGIKLIRRITMLQKKRTPSSGILKYTLFIPALLALFFVFSCDSSTNFKKIDHSAYSEPDEYPTLQNKNITQQILSKLDLTDEWATGEKVAKYCIGYEVDKSGKIVNPYFTNAKFAEDESWKNQSIDAEMEAQILKVINELDLRYTPAIKDNRPVKYFSHFQLIIGDKQKWHTYNASGTVMTKLPYADHRIGYNNPAEKASFGKMGLPVLSHKQCYRIPELIKYPEEAKSEKSDADVELSFEVDNKGYAQDIKVEKSAGELFDQSAVTAIATIGGFRPNQTFNGEKRLPITIKFEYGTEF